MNGQSVPSDQLSSPRNTQQRMSTLSLIFTEICGDLPAAGHVLNPNRNYPRSVVPVYVWFSVYVFLLDYGILYTQPA